MENIQGANEHSSRLPSLQLVRGVLEAVIVAALIWTGSSLIDLKTQTAVVQSQLASIQLTLAEVPGVKQDTIKLRAEMDQGEKERTQMRADIAELRKLRGLR